MDAARTIEAQAIIDRFGLQPHPEGGFYREVYRDTPTNGGRGSVTSIYYLLCAGDQSHWHRVVDATEIWSWHGGAPLELCLSTDGQTTTTAVLGLSDGQQPQAVVPVGAWQSARSLGDWTLVGCQVAPAFDFAGFEMAPPGWSPGHDV